MLKLRIALPLALLASACQSDPSTAPVADAARAASKSSAPSLAAPIVGATACDELIRPGETHFAHLWKVTSGVENAAEGYWSFAGDRLVMQATVDGTACDRILTTAARGGKLVPVSNGNGVTTCAYFMPGDKSVIYASTHAFMVDCPPKVDMSRGYVWAVHPEYDIYVKDLATGAERALTTEWGYDAEATVSPRGDRMVFTSTRSGDLELWTCDLAGGDLKQVTNKLGYDGGAFFSHDGEWLVFRSTAFTPGQEETEQAEYKALLKTWLVRPSRMEIMVCRPDGSERRRVTNLGQANFAPFFFPDDKRIVFASNHHDQATRGRNFDLFAIDVDGKNLEKITHDADFDGFPMFSPDGKWLAFASNRGGRQPRETNMFIAQWK
ncbi:MAG: PD40 domain-containing protein [Planctomycetes bacterium]|nr:PD40 domain-containing protein [Planctomycetota bacterium]